MKHVSPTDLELYALCRLGPAQDAEIEEHLLVCEPCRERLTYEEETVQTIQAAFASACSARHLTEDGVVEFWIEHRHREWVGRIESPTVRSFANGPTRDAVLADLSRWFGEMFPEHTCRSECDVSDPDILESAPLQ